MFEKINIGEEQVCDVLVNRILKKVSKNGSEFQQLFARDKDGVEVKINHFNNTLAYDLPVVLKATIRVEEYLGNKTFTTKSVEASDVDIKEFLPKGSIDVKKTYSEIVKLLGKMRPSLSRIVCGVIGKESRFKVAALSPEGAYARPSGVLEATYKLIFLANKTATVMGLDKDLMVAGACLYYVGYIDMVSEIYTDTEDAYLLGPALITQNKVSIALKELETQTVDKEGNELPSLNPQDTKMLLNILSGSFGTSTFPEATALKYLSSVVLNVEEQIEALKPAQSGEVIRDKKGRSLYKVKEAVADGVS